MKPITLKDLPVLNPTTLIAGKFVMRISKTNGVLFLTNTLVYDTKHELGIQETLKCFNLSKHVFRILSRRADGCVPLFDCIAREKKLPIGSLIRMTDEITINPIGTLYTDDLSQTEAPPYTFDV